MHKAFVLGAGLGTRLRPLTNVLPKPLIPVFHRSLITYAFDHLRAAGVRQFIVNTHHLPGRYEEAFPEGTYEGLPIAFRHEPVLLETAGGIANIADLVGNEPLLVYNGDILTDLPLAPLLAAHDANANVVTLVLRSGGPARHIAFDANLGLVTDIRGRLGTGNLGTHQFTGIYAIAPEFLRHLTPGKIESVIPIFLQLIQAGVRIGGVVVDEGVWWDLGDEGSYRTAHRSLCEMGAAFPAYAPEDAECRTPISPKAWIDPSAQLSGLNVISAEAKVEREARLQDCIVWPGALVAAGADLRECVVIPERPF